jgi:hypothetical protein
MNRPAAEQCEELAPPHSNTSRINAVNLKNMLG